MIAGMLGPSEDFDGLSASLRILNTLGFLKA
jgi:hypothetical protein